MQTFIEIDIKKIISVFIKWMWWIAFCALVGASIAFAYTKYVLVPEYNSSISMYVYNSSSRDVASISSDINTGDLTAAQLLINTYIVVLKEDIVFDIVAEQLLEEYPAEWLSKYLPVYQTSEGAFLSGSAIKGKVTMSSISNTEVLKISARTQNPELSASICTIIAESASDVLKRVVKAGSVEVISPAKPASSPSWPDTRNNCIIGFLAGGLIFSLLLLIITLMDNTVKSESDIKSRFDVPVLGEIPDFKLFSGRKKMYVYKGKRPPKDYTAPLYPKQ